MKRGGPLARTTPLQRTGGLARHTELARGGPLARNHPLAARRSTPRLVAVDLAEGIGEGVAKDRVSLRSGGWCEIQLTGCFGRALDWHHRLRDGQGGLWQASNGLHVCRFCHMAVTNTNGHRAEYEANGWLVRTRVVPADVPVLLPTGRTVWLDDDGRYLDERGAA